MARMMRGWIPASSLFVALWMAHGGALAQIAEADEKALMEPSFSPEPRYAHGMSFDTAGGRILVYGGISDICHSLLAGTWEMTR